MKLDDAQALALRLMGHHGLIDDGWTFAFRGIRRVLGKTNVDQKRIWLSTAFAAVAPVDDVEQMMLHEIAHALRFKFRAEDDWVLESHDSQWLEIARSIGYEAGAQAPQRILDYYHPSNKRVPRRTQPDLAPGDIATVRGQGKTITVIRVLKHRYAALDGDGRPRFVGFGSVEKIGEMTGAELDNLVIPRYETGDEFRFRFGAGVKRRPYYGVSPNTAKRAGTRDVYVHEVGRSRYLLGDSRGTFHMHFYVAQAGALPRIERA